jgi:AraC-like DNA-binding protein
MAVLLASTASLMGYSELVRELGGCPEALARKAGLDAALLSDFEQMISGEVLTRLYDLSAKELSCPCFCLLLSQRQGIAVLGPVGLMMRQSLTFHDAYKALEKYIHLRSEAGTFSLDVNQKIAIIKYIPHLHGEDHCRQICDLSLGIGCSLIRLYFGKGWSPRAVYFQHQAPPDLAPYSMLFHAPISFQQEFNGLVFDASLLNATIGTFEPEVRQFLGSYLDELERSRKQDIVHQVRLLIRDLLPKGACSLVNIAQLMGLKERALQRRLMKETSSFQQILDQVRQEMATEFLSSANTNLTNLAQILGYADLSTFSKAFKCWFGVSPSRYVRPIDIGDHEN